jgi:hypothetical protein
VESVVGDEDMVGRLAEDVGCCAEKGCGGEERRATQHGMEAGDVGSLEMGENRGFGGGKCTLGTQEKTNIYLLNCVSS